MLMVGYLPGSAPSLAGRRWALVCGISHLVQPSVCSRSVLCMQHMLQHSTQTSPAVKATGPVTSGNNAGLVTQGKVNGCTLCSGFQLKGIMSQMCWVPASGHMSAMRHSHRWQAIVCSLAAHGSRAEGQLSARARSQAWIPIMSCMQGLRLGHGLCLIIKGPQLSTSLELDRCPRRPCLPAVS